MKVFTLRIENLLKIKQATIPLKGVIGLVGKNAQGKTSVLKAVQDLLSGKNDITKIHDGAERAEVSLTAIEDTTGEELFKISQGRRTSRRSNAGGNPGTSIRRDRDQSNPSP